MQIYGLGYVLGILYHNILGHRNFNVMPVTMTLLHTYNVFEPHLLD